MLLMGDNNEDTSFGDHGFQVMGMVNALKTGDMHTDMLLAMCIPFVLKLLFAWVSKMEEVLDYEEWVRWLRPVPVENERFISYCTTRNSWGGTYNLDEDTQNNILLKAFKMYLNQVICLELRMAHLDLTGMENKSSNGYYYDSDYDSDEDDEKTMVGQLRRYKIIHRLPAGEWHDLGKYGEEEAVVRLRIEHETRQEGDGKEGSNKVQNIQNTTYHFTSPGKGAIDALIDTAYQWYLQELKKMEDDSRYYYEMKVPEIKLTGNDDDDNSSGIMYKRYKLSEEKTFDSLFFREKHNLLALVNNFNAKSGKYAIKGYPHKLGLLLHGPPGTGKTSLIKALAQYTGRSIVNVPLSRVNTNSELMSVFFDRRYNVEGSYVPVKLGFKDVIYVMEDCDAASKVVKRRDGRKASDLAPAQSIELPTPKSLWRLFLENHSEECSEVVEKLTEKSERLKAKAEEWRPDVLHSIAQRVNCHPALGLVDEAATDAGIAQVCKETFATIEANNEQRSKLDEIIKSHAERIKKLLEDDADVNDAFVNELLGESRFVPSHTTLSPRASHHGVTGGVGVQDEEEDDHIDLSILDSPAKEKTTGFGSSLFRPNPDALSLSGLLNVLDGVVDTPGRIVILTSNHPEMLDPALIRPGRVDKTLLLGFMEAEDVANMLELYYQRDLTSGERDRVENAVDGAGLLRLTPAQVEQLAAEHDELESMLCELEDRAGIPFSKTKMVQAAHQVPLTP
eukprot:Nitzschia sp. Nitz4//scaffold67_size101165//54792//56993//NITZ4_004530-RA/size101165-processed-gene-0.59-mRNA-1//-1//CDS//3329556477//6834//frame0